MSEQKIRFRLAEHLKARKISQTEIAEISGISRQTISKLVWVNPRAIRLDTIGQLCDALKIEPGELFERVNSQ